MTTNQQLQLQNELLKYQLEILKLGIMKAELLGELEINNLKILLKIAELKNK